MDRYNDKRIAEWLGLRNVKFTLLPDGRTSSLGYNSNEIVPNYSRSDAAAISLLPVLVEKGFRFNLGGLPRDYWFAIGRPHEDVFIEIHGAAIAGCISSAILQLIESEATAWK